MITVRELIQALQRCRNQDAEVLVWLSEDVRLGLSPQLPVDDWTEGFVDLNATQEVEVEA